MMGSFLTRGLVLVLGYAYPAYECFKTVEKNKPEIDQLRFWCQYWILVAVLTVSERVGDTFISWLPMYSEAKLAFFVYLWYPKTRGTTYVYDSFLRPYVAKHETEIDRNLMELRTRAGDMAVIYWQKAASYAQTRTFEIFQYVASQAHSRPRATQHQQPQASVPTSPPAPPSTRPQPQQALPRQASTSTTTVKTIQQHEATQDVAPPVVAPSETAGSQASKTAPSQPEVSIPSEPSCSDEPVQVETMIAIVDRSADPPPPETLMEESIRVTRGRPRKTRAAAKRLSR